MGEAKRRKEQLGKTYGNTDAEPLWPQLKGLPITKGQVKQLYEWSTRGAWIGIGVLVVLWITVRFIGPSLGWWQIVAN